jgi:anthranilate phosphoribosyltransferase
MIDVTDFKTMLARVATGERLDEDSASTAFDAMMSGNATPSQMGAFLMALRVRGETVAEITGAARIMRAKALAIEAPPDAIDTVGTGGDSAGTFNISTAAAIVVAGCGVPVAKHGNRNFSSKSGSADILAALGVNLDCDMSLIRRSIYEAGIGFMMAPRHHSATRHVAPTRIELGTRTIFNLLGPVSNPAHVKRQLVGVFAPEWTRPIAEVLGKLGSVRAWVVHGDGLDEITTTGATHVAELENGTVTTFEVTPEEAGLPRARKADLRGGDPAENAARLIALLEGERGPLRDVVLLNAAAALIVAGKVRSLKEGVERASQAIRDGGAREALAKLVAITNEPAAAATP